VNIDGALREDRVAAGDRVVTTEAAGRRNTGICLRETVVRMDALNELRTLTIEPLALILKEIRPLRSKPLVWTGVRKPSPMPEDHFRLQKSAPTVSSYVSVALSRATGVAWAAERRASETKRDEINISKEEKSRKGLERNEEGKKGKKTRAWFVTATPGSHI